MSPALRTLALVIAILAAAPAALASDGNGELATSPAGVSLAPGDTASVVLAITNTRDHALTLAITATPKDAAPFVVTLDAAQVRLDAGASTQVTTHVQAASDAAVGSYEIELDAAEQPEPGWNESLQDHSVTLRADVQAPAAASAAPQANATNATSAPPATPTAAPTRDAAANGTLGPTPTPPATPPGSLVEAAAQAPAASGPALPLDGPRAAALVAAGAGALALGVVLARRRAGARVLLFLTPLFTRLTRSRVLDQPTRERILALARAEPGISFREAMRRLDVGMGTLTHHLRVLERAGVLFTTPDGQHRRIFVVGAEPARPAAVPPLGERVLDALRREPRTTASALARALGVTTAALRYHLHEHERAGRVRLRREGRELAIELRAEAPQPPATTEA